MPEIIEITTTTDSKPQAERLARLLVEARLAACVQITGPIQSIYRWQGEICDSSEFRCTVKSLARLSQEIVKFIEEHHPYDTPEVLVMGVGACSDRYAEWLEQQLGGASQ